MLVKRVWRCTTSCRRSNRADRSRAALISWKAFMPAVGGRRSSFSGLPTCTSSVKVHWMPATTPAEDRGKSKHLRSMVGARLQQRVMLCRVASFVHAQTSYVKAMQEVREHVNTGSCRHTSALACSPG